MPIKIIRKVGCLVCSIIMRKQKCNKLLFTPQTRYLFELAIYLSFAKK